MIREIELINFQGHGHSVLALSPGLNVITGPSDNGKSSIIRAIRWVLQNRPQGDGICKHDTDETRVIIRTDNHVIERFRKGRDNCYVLDGKVFRAMRGGVPEEIVQALNISSACLQSQHDIHYLINLSPGEAAKHVNELADLSEIDSSIKKANSLIGKAQSDKRHVEAEIASLDQKIADSAHLETIEVLLSRMGRTVAGLDEKRKKEEGLQGIFMGLDTAKEQLDRTAVILAYEADVLDMRWSIEKHRESSARFNTALPIYNELIRLLNEQDELTVVKGEDDLMRMKEEIHAIHENRLFEQALAQGLTNLALLNREAGTLDKNINTMALELATLRGNLGTCPTCGAIMAQDNAPTPRRRP
jgi:exonuclease SbcC